MINYILICALRLIPRGKHLYTMLFNPTNKWDGLHVNFIMIRLQTLKNPLYMFSLLLIFIIFWFDFLCLASDFSGKVVELEGYHDKF